MIHNHGTFSLFLADLESVKICVPCGRPARVSFPDMFSLINKVTVIR